MQRLPSLCDGTAIDLRKTDDRREFSWRTVVYGFIRSRRRGNRRFDEAEPLFTDWHHPWLFFMATGIMILSCCDAFFTLQLINRGATEVNPVMAAVMENGAGPFAITKMVMTGLGILALVFLSRSRLFRRLRTGLFLTAFFSIYCCLVCYEFVLLLSLL